jgi:isopenicillin N synthase-like dioxygenase
VSYAQATSIAPSAIPVIDIGSLIEGSLEQYRNVADSFLVAAQSVGFFYVKNHKVPKALIDDAFAVSADFFSRSTEFKESVRVNDRHRGFLSVGQAKMQGSTTKDLKESFIWGREYSADALTLLADNPLIGRNQWPQFVPRMPQVLNAYFERCIELGQSLLRVFAVALDADPEYFAESFDCTISRGSTLYYPPQPPQLGDKQFGVAPHTDYGCLTLLYQDQVAGLQVLGTQGNWISASPIQDTFVVNVGDLLARWSNGRFRSTPHRVINESGRSRQSLAIFIDPDFATSIVPVVKRGEAARYEPTTCGSHILSRFEKSFAYRSARSHD